MQICLKSIFRKKAWQNDKFFVCSISDDKHQFVDTRVFNFNRYLIEKVSVYNIILL